MKTIKNKLFKILILISIILVGVQNFSQAQDITVPRPIWMFGVAVGGNGNFYRGSTQQLNDNFATPEVFHNGKGLGIYIAPTIIYHNPNKVLGAMLEVGYDSRKGKFDQVTTPCNCPADLSTNLSYISVEPSIRIAPFKGNFFVYAGPHIGFNVGESFKYQQGTNPDLADQIVPNGVNDNFSNMSKVIFSAQIGAGYDILLASKIKGNENDAHVVKQTILSPFVSFHPYFGQNPRSIETWNLTTIRAGVVLKFGRTKIHAKPVVEPIVIPYVEPKPEPRTVVVVPVVVPVVETKYNLFFKFDKFNLDDSTISDLDKLIIDMKNDTTIKISIKSYADLRGTKKYNIGLSQRRSKSVTNYIISKGINESRINSESLGETDIFNEGNKNIEIEY